jgi:hypothetical protein
MFIVYSDIVEVDVGVGLSKMVTSSRATEQVHARLRDSQQHSNACETRQ